MQMQICCNRPNNLELCSICEMNINVPSAELRPLASLQEQIQKWVALYSISLRTVALRTQCANMCSTYYREENFSLNIQVFTYESLFNHCHTPVH